MPPEQDSVLRAMTDDGAFRVIAALTTETVRTVVHLQTLHGATARHIGDLVTGTILVRETMAPQLRVQGLLRGSGDRGSMVADSHPDGTTRALAHLSAGQGQIEVGLGATLQMMRTLHTGRLHQGIVELPDNGGLSEALMTYMQISEQVTCVVAVGTIVADTGVLAAGGYLVQLLPEAKDGSLTVMTARLEDFAPILSILDAGAFAPASLLDEILYRMPYTALRESHLRFGCNCSHLRVVAGLASLHHAEIEDLVRQNEVLNITCDFCGKHYAVAPEQLRGLLRSN